MTKEELRTMVREELARALWVIMSGKSANSNGQTEDISNLLQGMATIEGRPIMKPYGLVSRAPKDTPNVVGRMGNHAGNRIVLGHYDTNAPDLSNEGDVMLYDASGAQILLSGGNIKVGTGSGNAAARKNDAVDVGTLMLNVVSSVLSGTYTPPGGLPITVVPNTPFSLSGKISAGSSKVTVED